MKQWKLFGQWTRKKLALTEKGKIISSKEEKI
jgi:hypothetical protein